MDIILSEEDIRVLIADALGLEDGAEKIVFLRENDDSPSAMISDAAQYIKGTRTRSSPPSEDTEPKAEQENGENSLPSADASPLTMEELQRKNEDLVNIPPPTKNGREQL